MVRAVPGGRTTGEATLKSILVPLDGSKTAEKALPTAAKLAAKLNLEIVLFCAYSNPLSPFITGSGHYAMNLNELMKEVREEAAAYLEAGRTWLRQRGVEKISCVLREGDAAEQIVAAANESPDTLIVMSSHGRSGLKRWVLGSVA